MMTTLDQCQLMYLPELPYCDTQKPMYNILHETYYVRHDDNHETEKEKSQNNPDTLSPCHTTIQIFALDNIRGQRIYQDCQVKFEA